MKTDEISAVHRTGPKSRKGKNGRSSNLSNTNSSSSRAILVKFTSRKAKAKVMASRRLLKGKTYQKVYINDDLTPLRSKMLHIAKRNDKVDRVSTTPEGKIRCVLKKAPGQTSADEKVVFLDTPDDLFHLGLDKLDLTALGGAALFHLGLHWRPSTVYLCSIR